MGMGHENGLRMESMDFLDSILTAVDHDLLPVIADHNRTVHAMPSGAGLDVTPGTQKRKLHDILFEPGMDLLRRRRR
jgi:hypothetical protein